MKKINLNNIIIFLSGAILFLAPIRKLTTFFGFVSIQQILAIFLLFFFMIAYISGKINHKKSLILFIAIIFIYDMFLYLLQSSTGVFPEISYIFDRYKFWLFAFILYSINSSFDTKVFFGRVIIFSSSFASILGLFAYFINLESLQVMASFDVKMYRAGYGLEFDTNYFATIMTMSLPFHFNFYKYFPERDNLIKYLNPFLMLILYFTIFLSLSRGAYITSFLVLIYYTITKIMSGEIKITNFLSIGIIVALAIFLLPTFFLLISSRLDDLFGLFNNQIDGSVQKRFNSYNSAMTLFSNNQLFGIGIGQSAILSGSTGFVSKNATFDNQFLTILVEQGVGFFIIYYGYIFSQLFTSLKNKLDEFNISLMIYLIASLMYNVEYLWNFYFLIALVISNNETLRDEIYNN